ncbi:MAG TPA: tetratricopeptide repeat protein [Gaiellaceae bacterium]|nr:tetratricopeptide repeat protein [Gaiellaceae bacterium]
MQVTEATFERDVVERSRATPVVVDFWADWCAPCHMLDPVLSEAVESRAGSVVLAKVDIDSNPALADRFGIRGIPAVKGFKNGRVAGEFVGVQSRQGVDAFLDALTGPSAGERLLAELQASGELPEIVGPLAEGDYERALEWLLAEVVDADRTRRDRIRGVMVALFEELGHDHPLTQQYRRRLATALY